MKTATLKRFGAVCLALAVACGAMAEESTISILEGETARLTTSGKVYQKSDATFTVSSGTGQVGVSATETGTFATSAKVTAGASSAVQTVYAKGLAFTPGVGATVKAAYKTSNGGSVKDVDTFSVYVAEAKYVTMPVSQGAIEFSTPTVSSGSYWNIEVAEGSGVVSAEYTDTSWVGVKSHTVRLTPKKAGTAIVNVYTRVSMFSTTGGYLRQRIFVTVTNPPQTKAVTLVQNDTAQFFFHCSTAGRWQADLNGTLLTETTDTQGGYVSVARSMAATASSTTFDVTIQARRTTTVGQSDILTVTDPVGNAYQYTFTVGRSPAVDISGGPVALAPRVCSSISAEAWRLDAYETRIVDASLSGDTVSLTAKDTIDEAAYSAATVVVSNFSDSGTNGERGATYTLRVKTLDPRPVTLCEGDAAEIYFHKPTATKWFLTVNGTLVTDGSAIDGHQMRLQLVSAGNDTDAYLTASTIAVGDGENRNGDLIVISTADGEEIYPYRANVLPAREVAVGASVDVACYSVTTANTWSCDLTEDAVGFVTVDCTAKETPAAMTTATITGLARTTDEGAVVAVRNNAYSHEVSGAQGGVYYLSTRVAGVPTIPVYLSAGVTMPVAFGNEKAAAGAAYQVSGGSETLTASNLQVASDGKSFTLDLAAAPTAAQGETALVTVTCDGEELVKYTLIAMQSITLEKDTVAPGFLYGAPTPWTTTSSNPAVFTAQPVVYNKLYSAEGRAINPGDAVSISTNTTLSAGYWGIAVRVYAVHESAYQIHTGTAEAPAELVTFTLDVPTVGDAAEWTVGSNEPGGVPTRVTVTLTPVEGTPSATQVTIAAKTGAKGPETFEVSNGYYVERISVYVTDDTSEKPTHRLDVAKQVIVGDHIDLPEIASSQNWTASVADSTIVELTVKNRNGDGTISGNAGQAIQVTGKKVGLTYVAVEQADVIYIYMIEVIPDNGTLDAVTVYVGDTLVKDLINERATTTRVWTDDILVATAALGTGSEGQKTCIITGVQEGKTVVHVETPTKNYTAQVTVVRKRIDRYVDLVLAKDGKSTSTYSYKYDGLDEFTNKDPSRINVTKAEDNETLIFKPLAIGNDVQVIVPAYVDGNGLKTDIHYHFTITKLADDTLKIKDFDEAYFAYSGEPKITETDDKVTLVFTDPAAADKIVIPANYTALTDILAVGGGGGGGSPARFGQGGGGGGGGGFATLLDKRFTAHTLYFTVGRGGPGGDGSELGHAYFGLTGDSSTVTDGFDHIYLEAFGGGGGGAPGKSVVNGLNGASGGGAAWYGNLAGQAGQFIAGQGHAGAVPTVSGCGAGGGGAGALGTATSVNGNGLGGKGRACDLSGVSVVYAKGGDGGRNDIDTPALAGTNPGDGGNGGNGGPGGDGANGTVVVTIKKLYRTILVPVPTTNDLITARFLWEDGQTMTPFDPQGVSFRSSTDSHPYLWSDVIDKIVGTTNVVCSLDSSKPEDQQKVGVGYYNFTIYLKEGFVWEVGEEESASATAARRYTWTIVSDWESTDAALQVSKTVIWDETDKMKATVRIEADSSPEKSGGGVPNVLFLGSLCNAHGFSLNVLKAGLNAITTVGNVDYKLYNKNTTTPSYSGSLTKDQTFNRAVSMSSNNHASLNGFYKGLDEAMSSGKKYDYIVFSFDRGLMATGFNSPYTGGNHTEAQISAWLKSFYQDGAVIWLIDDDPKMATMPFSFDEDKVDGTSLWYPSQVTEIKYSGQSAYWTSLYSYSNNSVDKSYNSYHAGMGLLDPNKYETVTSTLYQQSYTARSGYSTKTYYNYIAEEKLEANHQQAVAALKGAANPNQVVYDNAENVAEMITKVVKVKPFDLQLKDKIMSPAKGLTIDSVTVQACTNIVDGVASKDPKDWYDIIRWDATTRKSTYLDTDHKSGIAGAEMTVDAENNITVTLKSIKFEVLTRFDTRVTDDGTFRMVSDEDETIYNQSSGLYEKNPNDGAAIVSLLTEAGEAIGVEGDAETEIPWSFTAYPVEARVTNGRALVGGRDTRRLNVYDGAMVTTYYFGNPGYKLASLLLDQVDVPLTEAVADAYTLSNVTAPHLLQIEFVDFRGTAESAAATDVYDAKAHVFPVTLGDDWDTEDPIEIRYALTEEGPYFTEEEFVARYSDDPNETKVGDHTYFYRVFVEQPGYGEDGEPGFVDVGVGGEGTVTITPKPITITANSFNIYGNQKGREEKPLPEDYKGVTVGGLIGEDETTIGARIAQFVTDGVIVLDSPTYKFAEGQYPVIATTAAGHTDEEIVGENYTINYLPGVVSVIKVPMVIGGVTQFEGLDPENPLVDTGVEKVVKMYDGAATNLTVKVTQPSATDATIKYSTDEKGTWSETNPTFTHAGTYKVWYAVETETTDGSGYPFFPVTNYQYVVVNPRPITVASASAAKQYDGAPLVKKSAAITEGSLVAGDTIAFTVTGAQTAVGIGPNTFTATITSRDAGVGVSGDADYAITRVEGELTVTPAAMVIGGVEQPLDPVFPLPYGETGVVSVEKTYDGESASIAVNVTRPADHYTIKYTTDKSDPNSWTTENPSFTDAGAYTVYYAVEDEYGNYAAVTNFARVVIKPAEIVVTANDVGKRADQPDPELTATVSGALVGGDTISYTLEREEGDAVGEYVIDVYGEEYQKDGNYHVTYVPGVFSIGEGQEVLSLWITDHEYASENEVYLAFLPRGSVGAIDADYIRTIKDRIKVRSATTQAGLEAATFQPAVLRNEAKPVEPNGWIWIKVTLPEVVAPGEPLLWQIVIDD